MGSLWKHQLADLERNWCAPAVARLWEPRTGKTRVCVEEMKRLREHGLASKFLVVCPKTVSGVWMQELKPSGFRVCDLSFGPVARRRRNLADYGEGVVVINYDVVWAMIEDLLKWSPDYVVADESHMIKSPSARRSRAMHRLGRVARFRRILTGTPDPLNYADYYSQYKFLDPQVFGTNFHRFREIYIISHPVWPSRVLGYKNVDDLKRKIFSRASRVRRSECMDIPEVLEIRRHVHLPDEANKAYWDIALDGTHEDLVAINPLARLMRLQQITSGFLPTSDGVRWIHRAKIDAVLGELGEVLEAGQKAVVFCRFRAEQEKLADAIRYAFGVPVDVLCGDTPQTRRREIQEVWGVGGKPGARVLVNQIETGSLGISLAGANIALFTSLTFDAGEFYQAKDRIWYPGRAITYVYFVVPRSVDEFVLRTLQRKRNVSQALLDTPWEEAAWGGTRNASHVVSAT